MLVDQLRSEIEARIHANHPAIVIGALDSLLSEIRISQEKCSYHTNFQSYWRLNSLVNHLTKMYYHDGPSRDYSRVSIDDGSAIAEIAQRIQKVEKTLTSIRSQRYVNVCQSCAACKTRRRRWPTSTMFAQAESVLSLL